MEIVLQGLLAGSDAAITIQQHPRFLLQPVQAFVDVRHLLQAIDQQAGRCSDDRCSHGVLVQVKPWPPAWWLRWFHHSGGLLRRLTSVASRLNMVCMALLSASEQASDFAQGDPQNPAAVQLADHPTDSAAMVATVAMIDRVSQLGVISSL